MSENNNVAIMAKTIGMFNVLTGKSLTEQEGFAFIGLWDIAGEHVNGPLVCVPASAGAEMFAAATRVMDAPELDIPQFVGRDPAAGPGKTAMTKVVNDAAQTGTGAMIVGPTGVEHIDTRAMHKSSEEDEAVGEYSYAAVAQKYGISEVMLKSLATAESSSQIDPETERQVDAAWQARSDMQAREAEWDNAKLIAAREKAAAERSVEVTHRSHHLQGYDWQVCALCRSGSRPNSTIRLYREEPTPAEFYELYKLYDQQTHWVFINTWNPSTQRWDKCLDQYMKENERDLRNLRGTIPRRPRPEADAELVGRDVSEAPVSAEWEEPAKPFRIRYYSDAANAVVFFYTDKKPSGSEMAHFHHTKALAVVQARPKA